MNTRKAVLYLEDGRLFEGLGIGAEGESVGEVVFNTSMTGYQEILTDPSYAGQIVVMTQPEIGNYGVNREDEESRKPFVEGLIVRECSTIFSNWRGENTLDGYLQENSIPGIAETDTRALVRHIRGQGAMRGILSTVDLDPESLKRKVLQHPTMEGSDYVHAVTSNEPYSWASESPRFRVVAYDFGIKRNILRSLASRGCDLTIVPATTSAEDVLALNPDGIFLSNGPGDPEPLDYIVKDLKKLIHKKPVFGICLGHQLLGLAFEGKTYKLKFGHRGGNHPVKNLITGKVEISAHNHGFAVDPDSLKASEIQLTHLNLNDQTLEGFRHRYLPVFSVQYHPEGAPGPHDSLYLFDDFLRLMKEEKDN
ncbi:MAG: carbamoyl-phosphate synthase small subunit [Acidobacteria bacterium]|nr:glutamine-hydrolyzing carbamoyl-phosphate synthase small subunit [Acidobacteriota bacterium]TDI09727.1 MAG: carbamoyl-phosphate synthase small subunit [Acidobacteriota bacterium]TDI17677.1 MAG: carbamoyl-phosphate synthase small subunit [Acidobacteriota bacterium]